MLLLLSVLALSMEAGKSTLGVEEDDRDAPGIIAVAIIVRSELLFVSNELELLVVLLLLGLVLAEERELVSDEDTVVEPDVVDEVRGSLDDESAELF